MGIGSARGDNRARQAAEIAIASPLLEASMEGAHGVLLSIYGGSDLGLFEINEAASLVAEAAHPEANIIFGAVIDDTLGDEVKVTVIAAGFDSGQLPYKKVDVRRELDAAARRSAADPVRRGRPPAPMPPRRRRSRPRRQPVASARTRCRRRTARGPASSLDDDLDVPTSSSPDAEPATADDERTHGAELVGVAGRGARRASPRRARPAGATRASVTLVAVTKTYPVADVATLARLGVLDIGESRDQEARAKVAELRAARPEPRRELRWHFVGQLQSRKCRSVASATPRAVHSVDRPELVARARRRRRRRPARPPLDVFVQVSLDGDPDRGGAPVDERRRAGRRGRRARGAARCAG